MVDVTVNQFFPTDALSQNLIADGNLRNFNGKQEKEYELESRDLHTNYFSIGTAFQGRSERVFSCSELAGHFYVIPSAGERITFHDC